MIKTGTLKFKMNEIAISSFEKKDTSSQKIELRKGESAQTFEGIRVKFTISSGPICGNKADISLKINNKREVIQDGEEIKIGSTLFRAKLKILKLGKVEKLILIEEPKSPAWRKVREFVKNLF